MKRRRAVSKKWLYSIIAAAVLLVGVVVLSLSLKGDSADNKTTQEESSKQQSHPEDEQSNQSSLDDDTDKPAEDGPVTDIDPALIGSTDIAPAGLTVSYMKGVGGFEYEVLRAEGGRKYIELRNSELIGSKCDNDAGAFASIIETPSESEQGTLAKTTVVDGVKYGLSLALPTCTNNESLLKSYQDAFSKPFSLLKKL